MRGHGTSGTRGDIGYVGQLEDDLADFVAVVAQDRAVSAVDAGRPFRPAAALRCAWRARRSRTCSSASCCSRPISATTLRPPGRVPAAGRAPISRASSACWRCARSASPAVRRCRCWRFAVPPNSEKTLVSTYTDRLMRNFAVRGDFRRDLAAATKPLTIISGADDELMFSDKYAEAVRGAKVAVDVKVIDGINHMGIVSRAEGDIHRSPRMSPRAPWRGHSAMERDGQHDRQPARPPRRSPRSTR